MSAELVAHFLQLQPGGEHVAVSRASGDLAALQQAPKTLSRVWSFTSYEAAKAHLQRIGKLIDACWQLMSCMRDLRIRIGSITEWWFIDGCSTLKIEQTCLKFMMRVRVCHAWRLA